jgi:hypothetical protein
LENLQKEDKNMKKRLFGLAIVALFVLLVTGTATAISISFLEPPGGYVVAPGKLLNPQLIVDGLGDFGPDSLSVFQIDVTYDPANLMYIDAMFGPFLGVPDTNLALFLTTSPETDAAVNDSVTGTVNLFELSFLEADGSTCFFCIPPYLDDIQPSGFFLAELTFRGLSPGTSTLGLQSNALGDGFGDPLSATVKDASVLVTPEPVSLTLVGSGVIGLFILSRRRSAGGRQSS